MAEEMIDQCQENYFVHLATQERIFPDKVLEKMSHFLPQGMRNDLHLLGRKIDS